MRVVGIGGSAGAVQAVTRLLEQVRADSDLAFVVLIHRGPGESALPELLQAHCGIPVEPAADGVRLQANRVYVAPPGADLDVSDGALRVVPADPERLRAPIDHFLRALARERQARAIAVILSGAGADGTAGVQAVKEIGGLTVVQSPEEAEYDGMPRSAIATGLVDVIAGAADIPGRLADLAGDPGQVPGADAGDAARDAGGDGLRDILAILRLRTGHDFSSYKRGTLLRRVGRRMQVCDTESMGQYLELLRERPAEMATLLRDFLISVTGFFRDPAAFAALASQVLPRLFGVGDREPIRVWVAGCATGEEAYTLAILAAEAAGTVDDPPRVQIFATDIDEDALATARAGFYPDTIAGDLDRRRLERFFVRDGTGYRVKKELRGMLLFSPHNLLRDPPFSRLDLVSCRNLLIYLGREAQDRVLGTLHFGLRPDGYLLLGASESAETVPALFGAIDAKLRLYQRRPAVGAPALTTMFPAARWPALAQVPPPPVAGERLTSVGELHHRLVERYAAPSVLVNEELDVVHVSEHAGRFLTLAGGEPTRNLLRLVRPELRLDVRAAVYATRRPGRLQETRRARLHIDGRDRVIEIQVRAVDAPEAARGMLLVLFDEHDPGAEPLTQQERSDGDSVVHQLEEELTGTREQLRVTVEQYETSVEELKASNEELHAINEELRAATEELETSKEELQAVNEELTTVNHELEDKVAALDRLNSDLENLMTSTDIGVLFLDRDLNLKRFTPRARQLFNVIPADVGRPIGHITHHFDTEELADHARQVLYTLRTMETEVGTRYGDRFLLRLTPYRTIDDHIEGVVLTFFDISELKRIEVALRAADRSKDEFLAMLSHELRNPLTPLRASLDLLRLDRGDPARVDRARAIMERQVHHLTGLVDDLVDVSRITRGKLQLRRERFELRAVVDAAVDAVKPLYDAAGHALEVVVPAEPLWLDADFTRITQVLVNLLENACKYTRGRGRMVLTAERDAAAAVLIMRVRDNGIGIAAEMLDRVFEMFAQIEARGAGAGGLGIGLTLVRRLVEMHGGTVGVRSDGLGQGSEFTVRLPVIARAEAAARPPVPGALVQPRRILVVDDNHDVTDSVGEVLRMIGHEVRTANDSEEALAVAAEFDPDLVLLDLSMPAIPGIEVARRLRERAGGRALTLIALTGWAEPADVTRAHDAGFDSHLVKPVGIDTLRRIAGDAGGRGRTPG